MAAPGIVGKSQAPAFNVSYDRHAQYNSITLMGLILLHTICGEGSILLVSVCDLRQKLGSSHALRVLSTVIKWR